MATVTMPKTVEAKLLKHFPTLLNDIKAGLIPVHHQNGTKDYVLGERKETIEHLRRDYKWNIVAVVESPMMGLNMVSYLMMPKGTDLKEYNGTGGGFSFMSYVTSEATFGGGDAGDCGFIERHGIIRRTW